MLSSILRDIDRVDYFNILQMQRSLSPLFQTLIREESSTTSDRRPFNHTTYWIRLESNAAIDKLRKLKPYNYILICKRANNQKDMIIQYQTPTFIDIQLFAPPFSIREAPMRINPEHLLHTLKTEYEIIEEGGILDYDLIDKIFNNVELQMTTRSRSPINRR